MVLIICLSFFASTVLADQESAKSVNERFFGTWTLNPELSDDPDKLLKGKLRKRYRPQKISKKNPGSGRGAPDAAMQNYWETLKASEERKASKNLKRLGPAFLLLTFKTVTISADLENTITISYDGSPGRKVKPNLNGRVFSAKGEELTTSYFGHTLAYLTNNSLILETDAPDGGKFIEKLNTINTDKITPLTSIINASSSEAIIVPITVPFGTNRSESDIITLEIESVAESYFLHSSSTVMAGDIIQGTLNRSDWNIPVIPGTEIDIQYTLKNTGTAPSLFDLSAGFQQIAPGWQITMNPSTTPYMTVNEEIIVVVTVTPPALTIPFDPTTKLAEGNQLFLLTSVKPIGAGLPNIQQTILEVQPTVMVELLTPQNHISINESEISSGQITRFVDIDMQLRHNLISNLSATVDVTKVVEIDRAPIKTHMPSHPAADENGYIYKAPINVEEEMVDMLEASRQYQNSK